MAEKDLAVVKLTSEKNAAVAAKDLALIGKDFDMQQLELAINNLMFPTSVLSPCALLEYVEDKFSYLYSGPLASWPALFLPDHPQILARVRFPQRPRRRVHKSEESIDSELKSCLSYGTVSVLWKGCSSFQRDEMIDESRGQLLTGHSLLWSGRDSLGGRCANIRFNIAQKLQHNSTWPA